MVDLPSNSLVDDPAPNMGDRKGSQPKTTRQTAAATDSVAGSLTDSELETLRQLILGDSIEKVLTSPMHSAAVSRTLPKAFAQAGTEENELTRAIMPAVEAAIKESVRIDERILAEHLFPVIGPSTRKSISAAISGLVQSLEQALDYSVSPKSIGWRFEAFRTGKTFAEVVMLRTLIFQVQQVLLIHKETGLLLQHRVDEATASQDPDLVSAMLTAIEDFIQDSFSVESGETLDTLELGDLNVWIEEGPQSILACVVRGNAPEELRAVLRNSQEKIQRLFGPAMKAFQGDSEVFEGAQPYLDDCLHFKFAGQPIDDEKRIGLSDRQKAIAWTIALFLTIFIGIKGFFHYQHEHRWSRYITDLSQQPGLVILNQNSGKSEINGLRDPLAVDPVKRLATADLDPNKVNMTWKPYWSLDPALTSQRMQTLIKPPPSVTARLDDRGKLHLSGRASEDWIASAKQLSQQMFGTLVWQDDGLTASEQATLEVLRSRIQSRRLYFQPTQAALRDRYLTLLNRQIEDIETLAKQANAINKTIEITVQAYGDRLGNSFLTVKLGVRRARYIKEIVTRQGISAAMVKAQGLKVSKGEDSANLSGAAVFKVDFTR